MYPMPCLANDRLVGGWAGHPRERSVHVDAGLNVAQRWLTARRPIRDLFNHALYPRTGKAVAAQRLELDFSSGLITYSPSRMGRPARHRPG